MPNRPRHRKPCGEMASMDQDQAPGEAMPSRSFRTFRWVMVLGALAIAAVLLYRGDYLLGLLIGGLAVVRISYVASVARRRHAFGSSYNAGRGRQGLAGLARSEFIVGARALGLGPSQIRRGFDQGRSLAELAADSDVPVERIVDAVIRDASSRIDHALTNGRVNEEAAHRLKAELPAWAGRLVNFHKGDFQRGRWQ